ncbi:MAG TPA: hypothetical protein EYP22_02075 [Methanosarcinales archaeon]|nr:hypothetical protein [Methanosarcinales archaeon]
MIKRINKEVLLNEVKKGKHLKKYNKFGDLYDYGVLDRSAVYNTTNWYMHKVGIGATFEKNIRLVESRSKRVR